MERFVAREAWEASVARLSPEVIGPPECPILHRWTLVKVRGRKLMLHHFLPNADDRDVHDHPSPFITIVLRGGYTDLVPCPAELCGSGICLCAGTGLLVGDRMKAGMLRRRSATHAHRTKVGPNGCWTLVLMGLKSRSWGFWREGRWWSWADYTERFGHGMRCDDDGAHESLVRAAEAWCDAHRPEPTAYMAAMRAMADGTFHRLP